MGIRALLRRRPVRGWPIGLTVVVGALFLSLFVAVPSSPPTGRVVGALANLSVWLTLLILVASHEAGPGGDGIGKGIIDLAVFQALLAIAARAAYPTLGNAKLPLSYLLPPSLTGDPSIGVFSTTRLAFPDYYAKAVVRTAGIFGNPTWAGAMAAVACLLLLFSSPSVPAVLLRHQWLRLAAAAFVASTIYLAYARIDFVALVVACLGVLAVRTRALLSTHGWAAAVSFTACLAAAAAPSLPLSSLEAGFNAPRQGSLTARSAIYGPTWHAVIEATNPLLGTGIKEREAGLVASLGSHSTYLGLAYRGGVLATAGLVVFLLSLLWRSWRCRAEVPLALALFLIVWSVTEDLDAGHLLPLGLVVAYGLMVGQEAEWREPEHPGNVLTW